MPRPWRRFSFRPRPRPVVVTPPASGVAAPSGNLPGWTLDRVQDFSTDAARGQIGSVYGQDLRGYDGYQDTSKHGTYVPDQVLSVSGSNLVYDLRTIGGVPNVACPVPFGYGGLLYGRFAVRLKATTTGTGYKIAFLLWPSSDDWADGEIDWPEVDDLSAGSKPRQASKILGNYESTFKPSPLVPAASDLTDWHTAVTEWTPGAVRAYWDGVLVSTVTDPAYIPTKPMRFTLQAETTTFGAAPAAGVTAQILVDWVAQYRYTP